MKTETAPPKLFDSPECPEWRKGHYEHDWVCVISGINCRIDLGYGEWDAECDIDNSSHKTRALALKWLRSRIIAHRDALLKVAPVDEWLPIESDPKDGKPVLLLISDGVATVGEWCGASETWDSQYVTTGEYRDPDEYGPIEDGEVWVTHYRPLPQPPKEMR